MNVMKAITGIPFIGRRKIMLPYSIHGNLQDITKTLMTEEKDKTPIYHDIPCRTNIKVKEGKWLEE